ncbi:hypothetical protein STEG23_023494, partial [Scotinomys teguina]
DLDGNWGDLHLIISNVPMNLWGRDILEDMGVVLTTDDRAFFDDIEVHEKMKTLKFKEINLSPGQTAVYVCILHACKCLQRPEEDTRVSGIGTSGCRDAFDVVVPCCVSLARATGTQRGARSSPGWELNVILQRNSNRLVKFSDCRQSDPLRVLGGLEESPPPLEDDKEEGEEEDEEIPVTDPPLGQSYQKLSFCFIERLKSACADYGPTAPFTLSLLENQTFITQPLLQCALLQPLLQCALLQPLLQCALLQPLLQCALLQPLLQCALLQPLLQCALLQPLLQCALLQPFVVPSGQDESMP